MNSDTVNKIVRAPRARNAAPRLTQPVSDRCGRTRMLAWRQRHSRLPLPVRNDTLGRHHARAICASPVSRYYHSGGVIP
jgi:hypothetical protein